MVEIRILFGHTKGEFFKDATTFFVMFLRIFLVFYALWDSVDKQVTDKMSFILVK